MPLLWITTNPNQEASDKKKFLQHRWKLGKSKRDTLQLQAWKTLQGTMHERREIMKIKDREFFVMIFFLLSTLFASFGFPLLLSRASNIFKIVFIFTMISYYIGWFLALRIFRKEFLQKRV